MLTSNHAQLTALTLLALTLPNYCADTAPNVTNALDIPDPCFFSLKKGKFSDEKTQESLLNGSLREINVNIQFSSNLNQEKSEYKHGFTEFFTLVAKLPYLNLARNATLTQERLSYHAIFVTCLSDFIEKTTTLEKLDLRCTGLGGLDAKTIAKALAKNHSLKKLDLIFNDISPQGAQYFSEALQQNTTLTKLTLLYNPKLDNCNLQLDKRIIVKAEQTN